MARSYSEELSFRVESIEIITHWKRLSDKCENSIALMNSRLRALNKRSAWYCFSSRQIFWKMRNGSAPFSHVAPLLQVCF